MGRPRAGYVVSPKQDVTTTTDRDRALRLLGRRVKITLAPGWRWRYFAGRGYIPVQNRR